MSKCSAAAFLLSFGLLFALASQVVAFAVSKQMQYAGLSIGYDGAIAAFSFVASMALWGVVCWKERRLFRD